MKFIAAVLLGFAALAFSNPAHVRSAQRIFREDGHTYVVEYVYSKDLIERPAFQATTIRRVNTHYEAEISVYEVGRHGRVMIAPPFDGYYTELGCIEDKPSTLVHRAISLAHRRD